jgi:hypothetical protein
MTYKLLATSGSGSQVDFHKVKEMRWEGFTLKEIGEVFSVSKQRIDQICHKFGFVEAPESPVIPHYREKHFRKLMTNYVVDPLKGCWEWQAVLSKEGYARISFDARSDYGHRVAYIVFKGKIPDGLCVCHTCDNPKCINPDHLWLGTHQQNMEDRDRKGRGVAFGKKYTTSISS